MVCLKWRQVLRSDFTAKKRMIFIHHDIPREDAALGIVRAEALMVDQTPPGFEDELRALLEARAVAPAEKDEATRRAVRGLLRNGRYKPKGRGKPASEYLLRTVQQGGAGFPRINAPVDVANYMSLRSGLPISLWDLDAASGDHFRFRLGKAEEAYVFNTAGHTIQLADLIVGCSQALDDEEGQPIVNPVKDSLATKTSPQTRRVAACIYTPRSVVSYEALGSLCTQFASLLARCGEAVETAHGVVLVGEKKRV